MQVTDEKTAPQTERYAVACPTCGVFSSVKMSQTCAAAMVGFHHLASGHAARVYDTLDSGPDQE